jgi:hypothetical protein
VKGVSAAAPRPGYDAEVRFLNSAGELDRLAVTRTYAEEVAVALSALDCVLDGRNAIYASTELTSGRRLFGLLLAHGAADEADLRARMGDQGFRQLVWEPNLSAARRFARDIRWRLATKSAQGAATGATALDASPLLVVEPGPFSSPGWDQPRYLAFWETLIRTRFVAVYFNQDWQYSRGCTFELAVATDAGISTFDALGAPLGLQRGIELVQAASQVMQAAGRLDPGHLEGLDRLQHLRKAAAG